MWRSVFDVEVPVKHVRDGRHGLPLYAKHGDSGFDFKAYLTGPVTLQPGERVLVPTGVAFAIPVGLEVQVRPRSGQALKTGLTVINTPGTIDSGYRAEVGVLLINHGREPVTINDGDRIAQGVLAPVFRMHMVEVDDLSATERGTGGYGSTGF